MSLRTCYDGCNVNKQMKVDLTFIHSITWISTATITECLNKHDKCFVQCWFATKHIKDFIISLERREITQLKLDILNFYNVSKFCILYIKGATQLQMSTVSYIDILFQSFQRSSNSYNKANDFYQRESSCWWVLKKSEGWYFFSK